MENIVCAFRLADARIDRLVQASVRRPRIAFKHLLDGAEVKTEGCVGLG